MRSRRTSLSFLLPTLACLIVAACTAQGAWDLLSNLGGHRQQSSDPWFDVSWAYRHQLVFDNSAQAEDLIDFPALVVLDPSWGFDYGQVKADGSDLRFVDGGSVAELAYEIEAWNYGGTSPLWVKVPQIDSASDVDFIYLYYGNPGASSTETPTQVWDVNYVGVWHLGTLTDSTINANNGTNVATVTVPAVIGSGRDFNGFSFVRVLDDPSLRITGSITMEAWCYKRVVADQTVVAKYRPPGTRSYLLGFDYTVNPNGPYTLFSSNGNYMPNGFLEFPPAESLNTWMHVAAVFDTASVRLYVNGAPVVQQVAGFATLFDSAENVIIGAADDGVSFRLNGLMDEVRISASPRSVDWIAAQYLSMTDAFIDYRPLEAY